MSINKAKADILCEFLEFLTMVQANNKVCRCEGWRCYCHLKDDHSSKIEELHNRIIKLVRVKNNKDINDKYGHDIGDIVLQQVAGILTENIHEEDIVGRFGGEEFIILTRGGQLAKAIDIAERCRKAIEKEVILLDTQRKISITASFGVAASINPFGITKEEIIRQADQALYLAKKNGRNQVRHFLEIKITHSMESKQVI